MAGGAKSLGRGKGCLRLHFERFDKNGYFVKFYNFKSDFFLAKRLTTLFYDFARTMSMSLLPLGLIFQ